MDETKAASLLDGLSPTTQYADFLKIWPSVETALERQINRKAIWSELSKNGGLNISYVTFTRFVKKKLLEISEGRQPNSSRHKSLPTGPLNTTGEPSPMIAQQPLEDKSETVASVSGSALDEARQTASTKNYAKIARNNERDAHKK